MHSYYTTAVFPLLFGWAFGAKLARPIEHFFTAISTNSAFPRYPPRGKPTGHIAAQLTRMTVLYSSYSPQVV